MNPQFDSIDILELSQHLFCFHTGLPHIYILSICLHYDLLLYISGSLFVQLSICLSACLSVMSPPISFGLSVCLYCLSVCLSVWRLPVCLTVSVTGHPSIHLIHIFASQIVSLLAYIPSSYLETATPSQSFYQDRHCLLSVAIQIV